MNKTRVILYSPVSSMSGYGACGRYIAKSLIENYKDKWDIKIIPCGWGNLSTDFIDNNKEWEWLEEYYLEGQLTYQPDIMITHSIPTEFFTIGKKNIGITAGIESTICAPQWIEHINRMDLVLVPSQHSKNVFISSIFDKVDNNGNKIGEVKVIKPIEVVGEGVDINVYKPLTEFRTEIKSQLDEIKEDWCFLSVGNWTNGTFMEERKGISTTIKVFLETFKNKKNKPALILKTNIGSSSIPDREEILKRIKEIKRTVNSKNIPNIYLLHGDLTDEEMNELYNHPKVKAMVSFTKGEGYGRPLLEFTQSKKPIIVSNWGGHLDFLHKDYTCLVGGKLTQIHPTSVIKNMLIDNSMWFSVDLNAAASYMNDMYKNYKNHIDSGKRLSYYTKENHSWDKMKKLQKEIIDKYKLEPVQLNMPVLKKVK